MTAHWVFGVLAMAAECCTPTPSPSPPGPPVGPPDPRAVTIYGALVEAGCLQADEAGVSSIEQEHELPDQPAWLSCLFDGGTIATCAVPCQ